MRRYDEACVPKIIYDFEWIPLQCFELYAMTIFGNKLLFIHVWDFWEMWRPIYVKILIYLRNFYVGKTGCYTISYRDASCDQQLASCWVASCDHQPASSWGIC